MAGMMTVADRVQLQQVLMNLMLNGIEAMKNTGGVLTVKSQLGEDGQIEICVNDTGPVPPYPTGDCRGNKRSRGFRVIRHSAGLVSRLS
jgi:hypothetical protein